MAVAGSLTYDTKLDTKGFQKGINEINSTASKGGSTLKNIIAGLGITSIISGAISTINASVDGAISRIDTLNNFPKVMSNLAVGSEDASTAIATLSDKLTGLPTTLDDAALSVQRFTSKNGDVNKSVDIFLAVNNAILAGGASMEIQSSALEQLSQSYAKGKMDMVEWRSIQTAMPAQLKQVATSMGMTTDELGEMLRTADDGGETMEKFIETIVKLNKEGAEGFLSFEEQAKNATGGIKTSVTNMKTAITRGVASVISSLDELLNKNGFGGITDVLNNVGKTAEKALKKVGDAIKKIDIKSLMNTLKSLIPIITAVVAGFAAYEVSLKAIQLINIVKNITSTITAFISLIPTITSAKDAMLLLNIAFNANPAGLVVAGIAGLTAGFVALSAVLNQNESDQKKVTNALKEYDEAMKEADETRQEYLDENMNEVQNYRDLYDELINLTDENGKVKAGYEERAQFIATTLNDALGTEIQMTDGVVQNYKDMQTEIANVIKAKRAKVLLDAQEETYNTALDQRVKLEEAYALAVSKATESDTTRTSTLDQLSEKYSLTNQQLQELSTLTDVSNASAQLKNTLDLQELSNMALINQAYSTNNKLMNEAGAAYTSNEEIIAGYQTALTNLSNGNYDAVLKMYEDTTNYIGRTNEETYNNYQTAILAQKTYLNQLKQDKDKYDEDTYNAMVSAGETKLKQLQDEQAKYKTATDEGQKEVKKVWNKSLGEQISEITGHKIKFKETANGNVQAYIDGVKEGEPMSKKEAKELAKTLTDEIDNHKGEAKTSGENLIDGTTSGIKNRNKQNSAFSAISSFGNSLLAKLRTSLQEHSPSKASEEDAKNLIEGFNIGVSKNKEKSFKTIDLFGQDIIARMQNAVNVETGKMSFSGISGSVTEILSANATFEGTIPIEVDLDGEKIYENQETIKARKNLQYGGVR